jgi:hypothetical protein
MKESYEQKVAREEREHTRLQVERLRKSQYDSVARSDSELQKQIDQSDRINADLGDLLRKLG